MENQSSLQEIVQTRLFNQNQSTRPLHVVENGIRHTYHLSNGTLVRDFSSGAGVASLGRYQKKVEDAIVEQLRSGTAYVPSLALDTPIAEDLARMVVQSTGGVMSQAIFYCSGSEATEAALKLAYQYHAHEKPSPQPQRKKWIARNHSYHGATLGALTVSGHEGHKAPYHPILSQNTYFIPSCNPYRDRLDDETDEQYVTKRKEELRQKIIELGEDQVGAFILEPVAGATLACVPAVPGYLKAIREVCDEYGVLLIYDEIMCGMGRIGHLHAWQRYNVPPDIQLIGKGLAAGFVPISGMLIGHRITDVFHAGPSNGTFRHGHTFQNHPLACAAAKAVLEILQENECALLDRVKTQGALLGKELKQSLGGLPNVGEIRGEGFFWGLELVQNKATKRPFDSRHNIHEKLFQFALRKGYHVYHGGGTVDGSNGDHIMIMPAFDINAMERKCIVSRVTDIIRKFFIEQDCSIRVAEARNRVRCILPEAVATSRV